MGRDHPFEVGIATHTLLPLNQTVEIKIMQPKQLADRLNEEAKTGVMPRAGQILHEHEAAVHIHESLRRFLGER